MWNNHNSTQKTCNSFTRSVSESQLFRGLYNIGSIVPTNRCEASLRSFPLLCSLSFVNYLRTRNAVLLLSRLPLFLRSKHELQYFWILMCFQYPPASFPESLAQFPASFKQTQSGKLTNKWPFISLHNVAQVNWTVAMHMTWHYYITVLVAMVTFTLRQIS